MDIADRNITHDDTYLLAQYQQTGDLKVLGNLFDRHMSMIYYVCFRYLKDSERSKDAVMEIFEQLIVKAKTHEIKQFKSWLYVLAKNYCLMQLRSQKHIHEISFDEIVEFPTPVHQEDKEAQENRYNALEDCLEKLAETQKTSVRLFFYQEKCYKEIVEITGYSIKDVKSYIQNGKRNLKNCMDNNRGI